MCQGNDVVVRQGKVGFGVPGIVARGVVRCRDIRVVVDVLRIRVRDSDAQRRTDEMPKHAIGSNTVAARSAAQRAIGPLSQFAGATFGREGAPPDTVVRTIDLQRFVASTRIGAEKIPALQPTAPRHPCTVPQ
jgi:hypothetical protein